MQHRPTARLGQHQEWEVACSRQGSIRCPTHCRQRHGVSAEPRHAAGRDTGGQSKKQPPARPGPRCSFDTVHAERHATSDASASCCLTLEPLAQAERQRQATRARPEVRGPPSIELAPTGTALGQNAAQAWSLGEHRVAELTSCNGGALDIGVRTRVGSVSMGHRSLDEPHGCADDELRSAEHGG